MIWHRRTRLPSVTCSQRWRRIFLEVCRLHCCWISLTVPVRFCLAAAYRRPLARSGSIPRRHSNCSQNVPRWRCIHHDKTSRKEPSRPREKSTAVEVEHANLQAQHAHWLGLQLARPTMAAVAPCPVDLEEAGGVQETFVDLRAKCVGQYLAHSGQ